MITVRKFLAADLDAVQRIDVATQREYRGSHWDEYSREEQAKLLWYPDGF